MKTQQIHKPSETLGFATQPTLFQNAVVSLFLALHYNRKSDICLIKLSSLLLRFPHHRHKSRHFLRAFHPRRAFHAAGNIHGVGTGNAQRLSHIFRREPARQYPVAAQIFRQHLPIEALPCTAIFAFHISIQQQRAGIGKRRRGSSKGANPANAGCARRSRRGLSTVKC